MCIQCKSSCLILVRDSSAVRWLLRTCCSRGTSESSTYGKQRIFPPTLSQHISTFRGYLILFSIRNPYINHFPNHFSIHSWPSYPQKVVLHSITARFSLGPYDFVISNPFWNICHVTSRKLRLPQCIMGDDLHINKQTNIFIANYRCLLRQKN
jgi:hypothetical protein